MESSAFVGVSLDSKSFSREWVRYALSCILSKHSDVELVLADRLLWYNKLAQRLGNRMFLDFRSAATRIQKRRSDVLRFLESEATRLPVDLRSRVSIKTWEEYCDPVQADLTRALVIAYSTIGSFRACVKDDVAEHLMVRLEEEEGVMESRLSTSYVLEETAMIIRITEIAKRPFDYYPQDQIGTLRRLYADEFADVGLTVDNLIGQPRSRAFNSLPLPLNALIP